MGSRVTRVMGFLHASFQFPTHSVVNLGQALDRERDGQTTPINAMSPSNGARALETTLFAVCKNTTNLVILLSLSCKGGINFCQNKKKIS